MGAGVQTSAAAISESTLRLAKRTRSPLLVRVILAVIPPGPSANRPLTEESNGDAYTYGRSARKLGSLSINMRTRREIRVGFSAAPNQIIRATTSEQATDSAVAVVKASRRLIGVSGDGRLLFLRGRRLRGVLSAREGTGLAPTLVSVLPTPASQSRSLLEYELLG